MRVNSVLDNHLPRLLSEWDRAEEAIKSAELIRGETVFAAVKELRYAGRLIVDALELCVSMAPHADTELRDRLVEATQNCIRARNDAVDASVTFIHKYLRFMDKTYGAAVLTPTFQNTWTQDQRFTK